LKKWRDKNNMKNFEKPLNAGFTLLEVLVAVLVLSFGLLGIAGLLLSTMQNNTIAAQRTTATFLVQDITDRINQNLNAIKPLDKNNVPRTPDYLNSVGTNNNCYGPAPTGQCANPSAVAEKDLYIWNALIKNSLPGGEGVVCRDLTPDDGTRFSDAQCDNLPTSPWVIKIFWTVRAEDQVSTTTTGGTGKIQRLTMFKGGT
jgi:type IV pilus assembly protein PilV